MLVLRELARREEEHVTDAHRVAALLALDAVDVLEVEVERVEVALQAEVRRNESHVWLAGVITRTVSYQVCESI